MSLLSPETLHVFLSPSNLLAVSRSRWRRRMVQTRDYPVVRKDDESLQDLLAGFSVALSEFNCRRVRVVLSHHFVQFRLLDGRVDLANEMEFHALAQLEYSAAFGAMADEWLIGLSDEPPGLPRIAAALSKGLLKGLVETASAAHVDLLAIKPYLAVMTDFWIRNLHDATPCSWLMLHEPGRLCMVAWGRGKWQWVRHLRVGEDWQQKLLESLQTEAHLAGLEAHVSNTYVCAPSATREARESLRSSGFRILEPRSELGFLADHHGAFAAAWMG